MGINVKIDITALDIRTAHPDEVLHINAMMMRSKAHWGYDAAFLARCQPSLTVQPDYITSHPAYVAEREGTLLGFYGLYEHTPAEVELDNLFIEPAYIGTGVGRALWQHAVAEARNLGYHLMRIVADPNAEAFYQKMGAVTVGEEVSSADSTRMLPLMHYSLDTPI